MQRSAAQLGREATDVLRALRPRQWAHFAILPATCFDAALPFATSAAALLRGALIAACVLAYGYLLNAVSDRALDRDREKNPLVGMRTASAAHRAMLVVLPLGAIVLSALAPASVSAATLVSLAAGTIYSVGPRLKAKPGICTLLNVACFAPLMLVGRAESAIERGEWLLIACFSALLLQNQLLHEAADADEDRRGGLSTTFLVFGARGTAWAALVLGACLAFASLWLAHDREASALVGLHAVPYVIVFPLLLARNGDVPPRMARIRRAHRACCVISGALLYLVTLAA
jgi:4-hydroxybenzoate polyprenyltransferase